MHKEYIPENMANKYYFGEADSSAHQRIVDVVVYKVEDDEEIGVIELMYEFDKINERDEFKIESAQWSAEITIKEAEDAIDELLKRAGDEFQEFIERCLDYDPNDDEEESWFI
jgi:histidinol dehydrogenase